MAAKEKPPEGATPSPQKKKGAGWRGQIMMLAMLAMGVAFMPFAVLLGIGMMPTVVSFVAIDNSRSKTLTLIVGFLNFSGCFPFLLDLAGLDRSVATALDIALNPVNLVIIYASAATGYMIDWAMTGLVANVMANKSRGRLKDIEARKRELVRRWGPEVTGRAAPENTDEKLP